MSSQAQKKITEWKEFFALCSKLIAKEYSDMDGYFQNNPGWQKYNKRLKEMEEIIKSLEFFGGPEMLKKYAAIGMEKESPDHFNKAVIETNQIEIEV